MGVYFDNFVGYVIDVTNEYYATDDDLISKRCENKEIKEELEKLGFVDYYNVNRPKENNITLIIDGMSGKYAKIIYIQSVEYYSDERSNNKLLNDSLKLLPVPEEIEDKIKKAYSIIFNSNKGTEVYLQTLCHEH